MTKENFLYVEKYRPKTVEDCILPDRLKKPFLQHVKDKQIPNMLLSGPPGVGKTTVAIAMCEEVGCSYMMINSSEERGIDVLRTKIKSYASTLSLGRKKKVIILDEADNITSDAQDAFRGMIEEFSSNCTFIFTCNFKSKIKEAIQSRCINIDFTLLKDEKPEMAGQFLKRIEFILEQENVEYDKKTIVRLITRYFPDYRRLLNHLQHLAVSKRIDSESEIVKTEQNLYNELFEILKEKNYTKLRRWVNETKDIPPEQLFRVVFDKLDDVLKPQMIPTIVEIIAEYQYKAAFVADQEINTLAAFTVMMKEVDFE